MKTYTKTYELFSYDELSEEGKEKAIGDRIDFIIETHDWDKKNPYNDSYGKAERLHTPWFLGSIIWEDHGDDIVDEIKVNEYMFFASGELAPPEYCVEA
uniref:Uncharacterized protein n=1 Tax=viral metagenome TaxID=1070528 RepID=A0A6H1ZHI1_9ZZZZ